MVRISRLPSTDDDFYATVDLLLLDCPRGGGDEPRFAIPSGGDPVGRGIHHINEPGLHGVRAPAADHERRGLPEVLPRVAAAIAQPLAKTDRIVIISGGTGSDRAGASKVTQDIANIVAQVPATVEALTGVDLIDSIQNLPAVKSTKKQKPEDA